MALKNGLLPCWNLNIICIHILQIQSPFLLCTNNRRSLTATVLNSKRNYAYLCAPVPLHSLDITYICYYYYDCIWLIHLNANGFWHINNIDDAKQRTTHGMNNMRQVSDCLGILNSPHFSFCRWFKSFKMRICFMCER